MSVASRHSCLRHCYAFEEDRQSKLKGTATCRLKLNHNVIAQICESCSDLTSLKLAGLDPQCEKLVCKELISRMPSVEHREDGDEAADSWEESLPDYEVRDLSISK